MVPKSRVSVRGALVKRTISFYPIKSDSQHLLKIILSVLLTSPFPIRSNWYHYRAQTKNNRQMPPKTTHIFNFLEIVIHYRDNVDDNDCSWWHLEVVKGLFLSKPNTNPKLLNSKMTLVIYFYIFFIVSILNLI